MKLVVLDCDGTLVDSQNGICEAMTHAFTGFGLVAPTREATLAIVGLSLPEAFAVLAAEHDEGLRAQMVQRYKSAFLEIRRDPELHEPLFDGVAAAVEAFGARDDIVLGIATGKSRKGVDRLFERERWAHRFLTVQTCRRSPFKTPSRHAARGHGGGGRHRRTHGDGRRHDVRHGDGARGRYGRSGRRLGLSLHRRAAQRRARTVSSRRATA